MSSGSAAATDLRREGFKKTARPNNTIRVRQEKGKSIAFDNIPQAPKNIQVVLETVK
jgi:hypothetical protein